MMGLGPATKVHLLAGATDMRCGFDGLYALARSLLVSDPLSGHVFGFCNKGRNRLKLLYWDGSGLWVCAKRLDKGQFAWPEMAAPPRSSEGGLTHASIGHGVAPHGVMMSQTELAMLLSGIDLNSSHKRSWHRIAAG